MVSAYRLDRTGEGVRRAVYSWVYNWLIQLSFGTRLRDVNFAFKLCRRTVLDRVVLCSEGSFIDAGLVIRTRKAGSPSRRSALTTSRGPVASPRCPRPR